MSLCPEGTMSGYIEILLFKQKSAPDYNTVHDTRNFRGRTNAPTKNVTIYVCASHWIPD